MTALLDLSGVSRRFGASVALEEVETRSLVRLRIDCCRGRLLQTSHAMKYRAHIGGKNPRTIAIAVKTCFLRRRRTYPGVFPLLHLDLSSDDSVELAPDNIRVNAICPVIGETALMETFMGVPDTPENRRRFEATIPLGRFSTPEDMGNAACFLCSDEARFVTGVVLHVDGGEAAELPHDVVRDHDRVGLLGARLAGDVLEVALNARGETAALTTARESLESHLLAFAAALARPQIETSMSTHWFLIALLAIFASVAVLVAYLALRQGDAVGLFATGGERRWVPPQRGMAAIDTLLRASYDLQPQPVATDYLAAATELSLRQRRRGLLMLVTNLRDDSIHVVLELRHADDSTTTSTADLRGFDIQHLTAAEPGRFRLAISDANGEPISECAMDITSGSSWQFVVLPEATMVIRDGETPASGDEAITTTSSLCR